MSTEETPINSTHLNKKDLEHFKNLLQKEQEDAQNKINELQDAINEVEGNMDDNNSSSAHHQGDLGTTEEIRETNYSLIEKQKDKLEQITAALDRIQTGNYGTCVVTGEPIQKGRLEAMPYTLVSVKAKEGEITAEQKERLHLQEATD